MSELQTSPERITDYSRLTLTEEALVLKLSSEGLTQVEIAQRLNCSQPTVSRTLAAFVDTRPLATAHLNSESYNIAKKVAASNHMPTLLEVLRDQKASEKQAPAGASRGGVSVIIGASEAQVQVNIVAVVE